MSVMKNLLNRNNNTYFILKYVYVCLRVNNLIANQNGAII